MSDPVVTVAHLRKARMCARGSRSWFDKHGLSWDTFIRDGYPASVLEATDDSLADMVVKIARDETP